MCCQAWIRKQPRKSTIFCLPKCTSAAQCGTFLFGCKWAATRKVRSRISSIDLPKQAMTVGHAYRQSFGRQIRKDRNWRKIAGMWEFLRESSHTSLLASTFWQKAIPPTLGICLKHTRRLGEFMCAYAIVLASRRPVAVLPT